MSAGTGDRQDWDGLALAMRSCQACPELVASRTHVVVGQRPPSAQLLLVGEAPGAEEDARGEPFVGRSGRLLDESLAAAGIDRRGVAVVNVLKCRPPGNRAPRRTEVIRCRHWFQAQLAAVSPRLVVTLGVTAAAAFFGSGARLTALRGSIHAVDGRPVLVSYHPSAALRAGPAGHPARALREDLAVAATLLAGAPVLPTSESRLR